MRCRKLFEKYSDHALTGGKCDYLWIIFLLKSVNRNGRKTSYAKHALVLLVAENMLSVRKRDSDAKYFVGNRLIQCAIIVPRIENIKQQREHV